MTAEERLSPPCLATQGLNQLLELPCILLPVEHPLPNSMTFLLYQDCRVSTDPNPQLVKLRHCCTSCNMGMESFGHLCYPVPPPRVGTLSPIMHTPTPEAVHGMDTTAGLCRGTPSSHESCTCWQGLEGRAGAALCQAVCTVLEAGQGD